MMTLRDLVLKVEDANVVEAVARLYDQRETEWLPEAIVDVLSQLRERTPDSAASEFELHIELTSCLGEKPAKRRQTRHSTGRYCQSRQLSYLSPFLCHPFARRRLRYSHRPGTARPQKRRHHHDLHPRPQSARRPRSQPARPPAIDDFPLLRILLDEKMFVFYYEPSSNSR